MSSEKKEYKTELVGCLYRNEGQYGEFWRSAFDQEGGQYILNFAPEERDYEFILTYDANAKASYEAYKVRTKTEGGATEKKLPSRGNFRKNVEE